MSINANGYPFKRGLFFSLRLRMLISFGLLFVMIPIAVELVYIYGLPFTDFDGAYHEEKANVARNLNFVADLKKERLALWMNERKGDAEEIVKSKLLKTQLPGLLSTIGADAAPGLQAKLLPPQIRQDERFRILHEYLTTAVAIHEGLVALDIADMASGKVIASSDQKMLGRDIGKYRYFSDLPDSGGLFIGFENHEGAASQAEFHLSCFIPLDKDGGRPSAALIMHLDSSDFIEPLLHTGEGLGKTGEALLVDKDSRILTSLKHPLPDGIEAVPFEYRITALPALLAARGQEGIIEARDYRGAPVLAAFRYLPVTSQTGWGLVVKRDLAEIYAPLRQTILYLSLVGLVGILFGLGIIYVLSTHLSRPVRSLSHTARRVERGDLNARADVTSTHTEEGILTVVFNSMVERIQNWGEELEKQVVDRTAELEIEIAERKQVEEAQRKSEEKYRILAEESPVSIMAFDGEGRVTFVNKWHLKTFAKSKYGSDFFVGKKIIELPGLVRAGIAPELERVLKGETVFLEDVYFPEFTGGHSGYQSIKGVPVFKGDEFVGGILLREDVTQRRRAEEDLKKYRDHLEELVADRTKDVEDAQKALLNLLEDVNLSKQDLESANKKLQELDRLKSMFIASMSHELRTPLNSIIGFTGIILQGMTGEINPEQRDQFQRVYGSAKHLLALINDVIDISKIEAGKFEVRMEEFSLGGDQRGRIKPYSGNNRIKGLILKSACLMTFSLPLTGKGSFSASLTF